MTGVSRVLLKKTRYRTQLTRGFDAEVWSEWYINVYDL